MASQGHRGLNGAEVSVQLLSAPRRPEAGKIRQHGLGTPRGQEIAISSGVAMDGRAGLSRWSPER